MMTEELIEVTRPLSLELDYADEVQERVEEQPRVDEQADEPRSKKEQIIALYQSGVTDVAQIVRRVAARPSYVASVLQNAGLITGYFDLYTTTARDQNTYSRQFRNILSFRTVEAAKQSIAAIARLYAYFERIGDRAGQHHAEVLALTGHSRGRISGKKEESQIFEQWLF